MTAIIIQFLFLALLLSIWILYKRIHFLLKNLIQVKIIVFTVLFYFIYGYSLITFFPRLKISFTFFGFHLGILTLIILSIVPFLLMYIYNLLKIKEYYIEFLDLFILILFLFIFFYNNNFASAIPAFVKNIFLFKSFIISFIAMINSLYLFVIIPIFYFGIYRNYSLLSISGKIKIKNHKLFFLNLFVAFFLITIFANMNLVLINLKTILSLTGAYKILLILIIVAIPEELFFRGLIIELLIKINEKYKIILSDKSYIAIITISSIIFALFHVSKATSISDLVFYLIFGLISGSIFIQTKNLTLPILLHLIIDYFFI